MKQVILTVFFLFAFANAQSQMYHPVNTDFESGLTGSVPLGWIINKQSIDNGYSFKIDTEHYYSGLKSGLLQLEDKSILQSDTTQQEVSSRVEQLIDASVYKGKEVILSAMIKTSISENSSRVYLWLDSRNTSLNAGQMFFSEENLIKSSEWKKYSIKCYIDPRVSYIQYGISLLGDGKVWIDDLDISIVSEDMANFNSPPQKLETAETSRLVALADILGAVRYYYPSFELYKKNWDKLALNAVDLVLTSNNSKELSSKLNEIFKPIAPAIQIYTTKSRKPKIIKLKPSNALENQVYYQFHAGPDIGEMSQFYNDTKNLYTTLKSGTAQVKQTISCDGLKGKKINIEAFAKVKSYSPAAKIRLRSKIAYGEDSVLPTISEASSSKKWHKITLSTDVPKDAEYLVIIFEFFGDGIAWIDNVKMNIVESDKQIAVKVQNHDFEMTTLNKTPVSWKLEEDSKKLGYKLLADNSIKKNGSSSLKIFSDKSDFINVPKIGEIYKKQSAAGISFTMPLTTYVTDKGIYPPTDPSLNTISIKPKDFILSSEDRSSRLATTILLWNVHRHFSIDNIKNNRWNKILTIALQDAALASNRQEFIDALNKMICSLPDSQARVWDSKTKHLYSLPFDWEYTNKKLIVTASSDEKIKHGDIIKEIDGKTVEEQIKFNSNYINTNNQLAKINAALSRIQLGEKNSTVSIKYLRSDNNQSIEHDFSRDQHPSIFDSKPRERFEQINDSVFYVNLTQMNDDILKKFVLKFRYAHAIIFDLRSYSRVSPEFLGLFRDKAFQAMPKEMAIRNKPFRLDEDGQLFEKTILAKNPRIKSKIYFLINENTIGKAEEIAALVKYYKLGTLIGRKTAGDISSVHGFPFPAILSHHLVVTRY